jgi:hypothetical protein
VCFAVAAVYEHRDGGLYATELSRGPWDPRAQHGGAPAAILMRAFEAVPTDGADLIIGRVTYELLRPVPLGELAVSAELLRPGRRVQLLEGSIVTPDGVEVVRARALRVARAAREADGAAPVAPPPGPETGRPNDFRADATMFPSHAMDIRFVHGTFYDPGPSTAWFKLTVPIIDGEQPSALQRLVAAADFPNGISTELDWARWIFINPDLTVFVEREPEGEWICLEASTRVQGGGAGLAEAVLYDERGRVGRSLQTLYVAPRATSAGTP